MYIGQVKIASVGQLEEFLKDADIMCIGSEIYDCGGFTFKVPNNVNILATLRNLVRNHCSDIKSYGYG